jgi:hypothetical protein
MMHCCRRLQDKNIWLHDSSLWDTVGRDDALLNAHVETIRWADVGEQQQQQQYSSTTAAAGQQLQACNLRAEQKSMLSRCRVHRQTVERFTALCQAWQAVCVSKQSWDHC